MRKRIAVFFSASLILTGLVAAQEIKRAPIHATSPSSGKEMFSEYCAVCHGTAGKGDGPAAAVLSRRPADLTRLTQKNNGTFPELQIRSSIKGDDVVAAHGTRDMPAWGELLRSLRPDDPGVAQIRVFALERYIESLQAR